jgi:beta-1,4-N-acetylglucosaminyltransferase
MTNKKILAICSSGGHLFQLFTLLKALKIESFPTTIWICFDKSDARSILKNQKVYWAHYPTNRNIKNLLKNFILAIRVFKTKPPDLLISTGAGVAVPFYIIAKLLRIKTIYIESFARKNDLSLTGKIIYLLVDHLFVQSETIESKYKKAKYNGTIY